MSERKIESYKVSSYDLVKLPSVCCFHSQCRIVNWYTANWHNIEGQRFTILILHNYYDIIVFNLFGSVLNELYLHGGVSLLLNYRQFGGFPVLVVGNLTQHASLGNRNDPDKTVIIPVVINV